MSTLGMNVPHGKFRARLTWAELLRQMLVGAAGALGASVLQIILSLEVMLFDVLLVIAF
jgi:hypothetical protein